MMPNMLQELSEEIHRFPGDRSEADWLVVLQYLSEQLGMTLGSKAHFGCYWIDDSPGYASAGGCVRLRGIGPVPGIESDQWEASLCWSGNRREGGYADAFVFPFLRGSAVTSKGRLVDCGANGAAEPVRYHFENDRFVARGWDNEFDEWSEVSSPGTVYWQSLSGVQPEAPFTVGSLITVDFRLLHLAGDCRRIKSFDLAPQRAPRVSLLYVNRNRERTNLVPWTSRPPQANSRGVVSLADCQIPDPSTLRIRLDAFAIRGGWISGKYHLAIRLQNHFAGSERSFTSDISEPLKLTIT